MCVMIFLKHYVDCDLFFQSCCICVLNRIFPNSSVVLRNWYSRNVCQCCRKYPILWLTWWRWNTNRSACACLIILISFVIFENSNFKFCFIWRCWTLLERFGPTGLLTHSKIWYWHTHSQPGTGHSTKKIYHISH